MRLALIYNICGIARGGNVHRYIHSLETIYAQQPCNDIHVCVSSCRNTQDDRMAILDHFSGRRICLFSTETTWPVNVTFNMACRAMQDRFGDFDGYCYVDSGITMPDTATMSKLCDLHEETGAAMTAARVSIDSGTFLWFQKGNHPLDESGQGELFAHGPLVIPIGKTVNLHAQIFDRSLFEAFARRPVPDIFASFCTESVFSFMCAAIGKRFIVSDKAIVDHVHGMDEGSAGFNPRVIGYPPWKHLLPQAPRSIDSIIGDAEARECGFGYEECQGILMHNGSCYDESGRCKDPQRLLHFMKNNLFIPEKSYDLMEHNFIS